ncbi:ABC transporter permease [Gordonibacter sp. 28C]|uniref:FtsX-like permease family protein n=1 Tax=Gordonibacter sp. 28C TaxID=2078569 RepID=UPI000DF7358F|nr:FtsX-like permease family protein [Gordonibacter sp. 28C]RDB59302.1 ABC transporter permease [Gordonibacter sp. 28C]
MLARLALGNVRKSIADFGIYFLTVLLGVAVFYAFNSMAAQQGVLAFSETQSKMFELLGMVIGGVAVFIAFVLVFLVVYANRFLVKRRKKEFGLYLMLGMRTGDVVRIVALESLIVGAASLVVGLAVGVGLSQLLLYVTSALFQADVAAESGFSFVFSVDALAETVAVFAAIFALAALLNARTVAKARLIDLLHAESRVEDMKLTSLPLSLVLFAVSVAIIGVSYKLLVDNGLMEPSPEFAAATVLVCVGTVLFFYALSGFLLKLVQLVKPLYLRGLNMFTLRQLNAKVNTTFASLSVVCLTLFLAITSVCGGIGIRNAVEGSLEKGTAYSASAVSVFGSFDAEGSYVPDPTIEPYARFAEAQGFDMAAGLRQSAATLGAGDFDALVQDAAQVDQYVDAADALTMGDVEAASGLCLKDTAGPSVNSGYVSYPVCLTKLSQVNAALQLAGKEPLSLGEGECAVMSDSDITSEFYRGMVERHTVLPVSGRDLKVVRFSGESLMTVPFPMNTGTVVVNDDVVPESAVVLQSVLDVQCASDEDERALGEMLAAVSDTDNPDTWPLSSTFTRAEVYEQSLSLSTVVAYLAIYLGFVLVIACAAILAIQQLSDASDNVRRYGLLRKLGAPEGMISGALFAQVLVYFLFPLLLAVAHACCALTVVTDVVAVFGHLDIGSMALTCAACFLVVYGAYFAVTYLGARRMIRG